jgi:hypothetical protein
MQFCAAYVICSYAMDFTGFPQFYLQFVHETSVECLYIFEAEKIVNNYF